MAGSQSHGGLEDDLPWKSGSFLGSMLINFQGVVGISLSNMSYHPGGDCC